MKRCLFLVLLIIILHSLFFTHPIYAITETDGDLQVTYEKSMFPKTIVWYPGLTVQKIFTVKNIGKSTHTTFIKANNTSQTSVLANNMFFKISESAIELYGKDNNKTMKNFWDNGETNLSDVSGESSITYLITITMPAELKNDFQEKNAKFDLVVGFVGTESRITVSSFVTPSVTPEFAPRVLGISTTETSPLNKKLILSLAALVIGIFLFIFYLRKLILNVFK